jgi:hypothetical protein
MMGTWIPQALGRCFISGTQARKEYGQVLTALGIIGHWIEPVLEGLAGVMLYTSLTLHHCSERDRESTAPYSSPHHPLLFHGHIQTQVPGQFLALYAAQVNFFAFVGVVRRSYVVDAARARFQEEHTEALRFFFSAQFLFSSLAGRTGASRVLLALRDT